jgi:hypothetical protein
VRGEAGDGEAYEADEGRLGADATGMLARLDCGIGGFHLDRPESPPALRDCVLNPAGEGITFVTGQAPGEELHDGRVCVESREGGQIGFAPRPEKQTIGR